MKDVNNCKMLIFIIKIENLFYTKMFKTYIIYFLLSIIDLSKFYIVKYCLCIFKNFKY